MEKWGPFKEQVDEKKATLDKTDAGSVRVLGEDPASGRQVSARIGRFGLLVQIGTVEDEEKPRFASLRPGQSIYSITLPEALELFRLPRVLGESNGMEVSVGIGRLPVRPPWRHLRLAQGRRRPVQDRPERAVALIEEKEEIAQPGDQGIPRQRHPGAQRPLRPVPERWPAQRQDPQGPRPRQPDPEEATRLLEETGKPARRGFGAKKARGEEGGDQEGSCEEGGGEGVHGEEGREEGDGEEGRARPLSGDVSRRARW